MWRLICKFAASHRILRIEWVLIRAHFASSTLYILNNNDAQCLSSFSIPRNCGSFDRLWLQQSENCNTFDENFAAIVSVRVWEQPLARMLQIRRLACCVAFQCKQAERMIFELSLLRFLCYFGITSVSIISKLLAASISSYWYDSSFHAPCYMQYCASLV